MGHNLTTALVEGLRTRILEGRIASGERLPGESTLIADQRVCRAVVREAEAGGPEASGDAPERG